MEASSGLDGIRLAHGQVSVTPIELRGLAPLAQNPLVPLGVTVTLREPVPKEKLTPVADPEVWQLEAEPPVVVLTKAVADVTRHEMPLFTLMVTAVVELLAGCVEGEMVTAVEGMVELVVQPAGRHPFGAESTHDAHAMPGLVNACHIR
jgi:hypothetical protein